jgi:hypothetical protein
MTTALAPVPSRSISGAHERPTREQIRDLVPASAKGAATVDLAASLGEIAGALGQGLPFWTRPLVKIGGDRLKKWLTNRRFKRLLLLTTQEVLAQPDASHERMSYLEIVNWVAHYNGFDSPSIDEARRILECVEIILRDPAVERAFHEKGLTRWLRYSRRRHRFAMLPEGKPSFGLRQALARAQRAALTLMRQPRQPTDCREILELIVDCCRGTLDDPDQNIDANFMIALKPSPAPGPGLLTWQECQANKNAERIFQKAAFEQADRILQISHSTNQAYDRFWVPVFGDAASKIPGAPTSYREGAPNAVFIHHPKTYGPGIPDTLVRALEEYFSTLGCEVFLCFPVVSDDSETVGVVNLNLKKDELKFMEDDEVLHAYLSVSVLLSVMATL